SPCSPTLNSDPSHRPAGPSAANRAAPTWRRTTAVDGRRWQPTAADRAIHHLRRSGGERYPRVMSGDSDRGTITATDPAPEWLRALVREIPDFPTPGIQFRDITP